jgi:hypothetical protein
MTLLESGLLAAIKALLELSQVITGGNSLTTDDIVHYQNTVDWAMRRF